MADSFQKSDSNKLTSECMIDPHAEEVTELEKYKMMIQITSEPIFSLSEDRMILFASQTWENDLGYPTESLVGTLWDNYVYGQDKQLFQNMDFGEKKEMQVPRRESQSERQGSAKCPMRRSSPGIYCGAMPLFSAKPCSPIICP